MDIFLVLVCTITPETKYHHTIFTAQMDLTATLVCSKMSDLAYFKVKQ